MVGVVGTAGRPAARAVASLCAPQAFASGFGFRVWGLGFAVWGLWFGSFGL